MTRFTLGCLFVAASLLARAPVPDEKDVDVIKRGASEESEKAVAAGLKWLALHQAADGHWGLNDFNLHARTLPWPKGKVEPDRSTPRTTRKNDVAGTAFACLTFLSAGVTPKETPKRLGAEYHKGLEAGLRWLAKNQKTTGEDEKGSFGGDWSYAQALATQAMCEAYRATGDKALGASAQLGVDFIVAAQDPTGGGWRYAPRTAGDTSVTGFMMRALKAATEAKLKVPEATLKKVTAYLHACESADKGGYSYLSTGPESQTMTAVGALCRMYLGINPRNPSLLSSIKKIKASPPSSPNLYYTFYATQVMYHQGGEAWEWWNKGPGGKNGIRDVLVARQDAGATNKDNAGSWDGDDHVGGRLGATSFAIMTLNVYRKTPLSEK
jgi:hypothetical protein